MKTIFYLAILTALSTPAFATTDNRAECNGMGLVAQSLLTLAKMGVNSYERLANDPERMNEYGFENSVTYLVVAQDIWENRNKYNNAQAFKAGYRMCMELK